MRISVKEQCWISRSSEGQGHDAVGKKGLDLSNIVCEYEVNPLTNDKVNTEIQNFNAKWERLLKNHVECQGHLKVKVILLHVCEKVLT